MNVRIVPRSVAGLFFLAAAGPINASAEQRVLHGFGGGPALIQSQECVSLEQRQNANLKVAKFAARMRVQQPPETAPVLYPFVPIAGTEWQDRFVNNFVDLDASSGILDWDCTDFTYDGHQGHDIILRSFGEQDIGVPVFAALDGTVVDSHDGEPDRNTSQLGQPANYVILFHGNTQYSWYFHLRNGSVAVTNGQIVTGGTQLGLAASSGNSSGPHLHFESRYNDTFYEPSAGPCRAGDSYWVNQIPIRRDLYIDEFSIHNTNSFPAGAFFPYNPVRTGTIVRSGTFQPIGCWYTAHNLPAGSTWRLRYIRPDSSLFFDSSDQPYNNPFYRLGSFWVWYGLNPDVAGDWTLELWINGQRMVQAPFTVLDAGQEPVNRAPGEVTAAFDPPAPNTNQVVFCRLTVPLTIDPDYDLMSYRYVWTINGQALRDVTSAAFSDAIPKGAVPPGALLSCTITPFDGKEFGPPTTIQVTLPGGAPPPINLQILSLSPNQISLHWPLSDFPYVLESNSNLLSAGSWSVVADPMVTNGNEIVVTTSVTPEPRFFRLRWP